MTTIAWDGRFMAADRRISMGTTTYSSTKIRRTADGRLIGATGDWPVASLVLDWLEHGGARPDCQSSDRWCTALEVTPDGRCWLHQRDGKWPVEDAFTAIGSGREYALAVMAVGLGAEKGVEVAARFDPGTGNGIDALEIAPAAAAATPVRAGMRGAALAA